MVATTMVWMSRILVFYCVASTVHAWTTLPSSLCTKIQSQTPSIITTTTTTTTCFLGAGVNDPASLTLAAEESWRQYVPLIVSGIVIVDILLGSPMVNLIVAPMKRQAEQAESSSSSGQDETRRQQQSSLGSSLFGSTSDASKKSGSKERIDSGKVAQEALNRARNSLELRNYLDAQKTDWDRMEDIRKEMDQQFAEIDKVQTERKQKDDDMQ